MKKLLSALLICSAAMTGVFADGQSKVKRISIGTAGTAGSLYPMGVAMAATITKHVPGIACTGEATAASV